MHSELSTPSNDTLHMGNLIYERAPLPSDDEGWVQKLEHRYGPPREGSRGLWLRRLGAWPFLAEMEIEQS